MKPRTLCPRFVLLFLLLFALPVMADGTREDYQRAERFLPGNLRHHAFSADVTPHWVEKSDDRFWYRRATAKGARLRSGGCGTEYRRARLRSAASGCGARQASKENYSPTDLPFQDFDFVDNGKAIRFSLDGVQWTCQLATYQCKAEDATLEKTNEVVSPNKRFAAYVSEHNLYLRDLSTGTVLQLTHDGIPSYDYATPLPSLRVMVDQGTEDVKQPAAVFWSPDSKKLITYRIDSRNSGHFTSLQFVPPDQLRPRAFTYVYPLPGEVLAKAEPIVIDIQSGKRIDVQTPPLELPFQDGPGFEWFADSKSFNYDYDERGYKAKELRVVDAATGEQKVLVREQAEPYVDPGETFFRFVDPSQEILWSSERDGWNHLYVYSRKSGQLENQITQGPWVVREISYVDEKNRQVYFLASGREKNEDPYLTHLYRTGFDGKALQLLTPENANDTVSFSADGKFFVDSYSRVDLPGQSVLRRAENGAELKVLEKADFSELIQANWKYPEPFQGKALDGSTDIYGLIWCPSNFDASKRYPIVEHVYTGPQGFFVSKTIAACLPLQSVAELGFIVVMVDGRGTVGRSRAFHNFSYPQPGRVV